MEIKIPGVDANKALDLFEGDVDTYVGILRSYISAMPKSLDSIRSASKETLWDYAVAVHGIKSISEAIGAEEARKTAKQLEDMAKGGDLAGILARNNAFINYAENLVDGIRVWLEKYDSSSGTSGP